jgi:hypothetical protein
MEHMSDQEIATIARQLAGALKKRAHDREPDDLKRVLVLQAILLERCEQELTSEQDDRQ